ncbi:LOW QUALITY PROTEIN: nucleotidyltransferase, partial [Kutzneria sp. 744]
MVDLPSFAARIADVSDVSGVVGVVLGGSRARGTADAHSDTDIGVYRRGEMDLSALREIAAEYPGSSVTEPGEWGPWVDGGAWLRTPGSKTDLLWRDLDRVHVVLAEAQRGVVRCEQQVGHPLGFFSYAYLAELATCKVLDDRFGALAEVLAALDPYPPSLAAAIEGSYGFEARVQHRERRCPRRSGRSLLRHRFPVPGHRLPGARAARPGRGVAGDGEERRLLGRQTDRRAGRSRETGGAHPVHNGHRGRAGPADRVPPL